MSLPDKKTFPKIVLIVEDDGAVAKVIKDYLVPEGYAVLSERTGEEAMEALTRIKDGVVLLDLGLPDVDGLELLWKIKIAKPSTHVIVVTGSHDEVKGRRAMELGAWDYVTKPIDFAYLKNILKLLLSDEKVPNG